jgi:hypothetical protein
MKTKTIALGLSILLLSGATLADSDCDESIASWQPRENLRMQLEANGWTVYRIKVDDGCYEVKALDKNGERVEASFSPTSLELLKVEHEDDDDEDEKDDRKNHNKHQSAVVAPALPTKGILKSRPKVSVE